MEILTDHGLILRWIHLVAGVTWIGLLWFFNWVNGPFTAALEPDVRAKVIPQLMPRCLWWFRWGAAATWVSGVVYAMILASGEGMGLMQWFSESQRGNWIGLGFVYGTIMAFNVWVMIWPRQKKIIAATIKGENPPEKAKWAAMAGLCSRINTYLSIPLLFAMGAAKHAGELGGEMSTDFTMSATVISVIGIVAAWVCIKIVGPRVGKDFSA